MNALILRRNIVSGGGGGSDGGGGAIDSTRNVNHWPFPPLIVSHVVSCVLIRSIFRCNDLEYHCTIINTHLERDQRNQNNETVSCHTQCSRNARRGRRGGARGCTRFKATPTLQKRDCVQTCHYLWKQSAAHRQQISSSKVFKHQSFVDLSKPWRSCSIRLSFE